MDVSPLASACCRLTLDQAKLAPSWFQVMNLMCLFQVVSLWCQLGQASAEKDGRGNLYVLKQQKSVYYTVSAAKWGSTWSQFCYWPLFLKSLCPSDLKYGITQHIGAVLLIRHWQTRLFKKVTITNSKWVFSWLALISTCWWVPEMRMCNQQPFFTCPRNICWKVSAAQFSRGMVGGFPLLNHLYAQSTKGYQNIIAWCILCERSFAGNSVAFSKDFIKCLVTNKLNQSSSPQTWKAVGWHLLNYHLH